MGDYSLAKHKSGHKTSDKILKIRSFIIRIKYTWTSMQISSIEKIKKVSTIIYSITVYNVKNGSSQFIDVTFTKVK